MHVYHTCNWKFLANPLQQCTYICVHVYIIILAKYFACCRNIFGIYLLFISTVKAHGLAFILYRVGTKLILYMLITHALMACTLIKI